MGGLNYKKNIEASGKSIYDPIEIGDPNLWIPSNILESILAEALCGVSVEGMPIRSRSKFVKELVCDALGYPRPKSFKKTNPRFLGQNFDTYNQKSNNLQVWNEELSATRRYVLIRIGENHRITKVKVVTGDVLAQLDTTGTLTQKFQARLITRNEPTELVTDTDTDNLQPFLASTSLDLSNKSPIEFPTSNNILPIAEVYRRITSLVGVQFVDAGYDQERNRGASLHKLACQYLGYRTYSDDGQFPDIKNQLIEVKLQTSPTIDLGLVTPASTEPLDLPKVSGVQLRHCDVRYALVYGVIADSMVTITNVYLTTGEGFFGRFPQFGGKVLNKKLQIPLPRSFFD